MRFLVVLALFTASLYAQSTEAAISGIITDAHGAVITNVEVAAVHTDTGVKTAVRTNETGFYSLSPLPIGTYTLSAEIAGFRRHNEQGIVLTTGQAFELNIRLEIGAVSETVTVSATGTLLETRTSDASQLIDSKTIEDMPLGDRRAMNVIEITGAAVFGGYDSGSKPNFSLAGGRMQSQMFFIDGASAQNMRVGVGQMDMDPPIDTLQEVKVLSNGFSAEFGGSAGGGVLATTKSGSNQIRGSLSEYLRNQAMDAPNFFSPIVDGRKQKPSLRYNVFGGTVGGPIKHDKTFFFFAYEGSRRLDGSVRTLTVPSLLERAGDFSQTFNSRKQLYPIYDPFTNPRTLFPGNIIPKSRFDPVALKIVPIYPAPNRAPDDATGANNFRSNDVNAYNRNNLIGKIDHSLGNNDKVTLRYIYNSDVNRQRSVFPVPAADTVNDTDANQNYYYGTWTRIVSPTIVNDVRFNYGRRYYRTHNKGIDEGWPSKLGFTGVPENSFPTIAAAGYTNLGSATQDRQQFPIQQYNFLENITIIRGRHTIKAGMELRESKNRDLLLASISGKYTFNRGLSGLAGNAQTGNGMATMLLGALSNFDEQATPILNRHAWYLAGFLQDDWTLRPGLTLNLGVRWEADTPIIDEENHMNSFDPNQINPVSGTPGVVKFLGLNGYTSQPYRGDYNNFGPRVGFAWKPFGLEKTVLRGGFGIFYAHPFDGAESNTATLGFAQSSSLVVQDNTTVVPYTLGGGLPIAQLTSPVLDDSFGAVKVGQAVSTTVTYLDPNRRTGYSEQFNLRIQHELPGAMLVEIGYLGNLSRKLPGASISINQIRPELLGPASQQRNRPFPQFSGITILAPAFGVSSYNAGTAKIEKRFAHGFSVLATYTWAKFLDNTGGGPGAHLGDEGAAYSDYYNRRNDWGPSENDIRQRVTWSSVYQIPLGKGRRYFNSGPARNVIGGWQIGSVVVVQTGAPSTVQTQTNTTFAFSSGAQRADVLQNPNLPSSQRTLDRWYNTDAFGQPATNQFGNQGVGLVRADGIFNVNTSIIRAFHLAERKMLQFRGEFFNLFNHPNFLVPGHTYNGAGFGIVSAARPARQVQLGLRLTF